MEKKQTAVEWLFKELQEWESKYVKSNFKISIEVYETTKTYLKEKANAMHKEQIKDAYDWGETNGSDECNGDGPTHDNFDQYYTETYEQP
jgi:hypothetical protein